MTITKDAVRFKFKCWDGALDAAYRISKTANFNTPNVSIPVQAHYTDDAILLPTVKHKICDTPQEIIHHYDSFIQNKPQAFVTEEGIYLAENVAVHGTEYNFTLEDRKTGEYSEIDCDFTLVAVRQPDGSLLYAHHHSSLKEHESTHTIFGAFSEIIEDTFKVKPSNPIGQIAHAQDSKRFAEAQNDLCCKLQLTDQHIVSLPDNLTLYCGHMELQENVGKSEWYTDHRFTMVFDENGRNIREQFSKRPDQPKGIFKMRPDA